MKIGIEVVIEIEKCSECPYFRVGIFAYYCDKSNTGMFVPSEHLSNKCPFRVAPLEEN